MLPADLPIVVLVDRLSASASEIVAACLQDHERAAIVGQRTWGKGTVQNVIKLEGGRSAIRLTVGSYHRPSGKEIHKWKEHTDRDDWGVQPDPDLEVVLTNHENDLIVLARQKRDRTPWEVLRAMPAVSKSDDAAPAADPPRPVPQADAEGQTAEQTPALEAEAESRAKQDPAVIDPQLRKALEHLEQQINQKNAKPVAA
jgi:carboxyl-terminal processing protease